MYAIIQTGGKQYKVHEGDRLQIEKILTEEGETVVFDEVLMLNDGEDIKVGDPLIGDAKVTGKVLEHGKGKKVIIYKYKPKANYRKKRGHRQPYSEVEIEKIEG